jgi:PAS domain S-box-containing protein
MLREFPKILSHALARRLILWTILFSGSIALVISVIQLVHEYRDDIQEVEERFAQIERSHLPGIVEGVWVSDRKQLLLMLEGISRLRDFSYAEVRADGEVLAAAGDRERVARMTRRWPLSYDYRGRRQVIGELVVLADLETTRARSVERAVFIVAANLAKTALVALFMFLLVHRLITRHLESFARHVGQASFETLNTPVVLERKPPQKPDELDMVVVAYNNMRENLAETYNRVRPLSQAVEQSPVSIFITDTEARIQYVNRHFTRVTGYRPDEVLGRNPRMFNSGQTPPSVFGDMWRTIAGGGIWSGRLYNKKKDGTLYWEDTVIAGITDEHGRIANYVAVKEDISARVEAERRIHELNESLECRVAERTAELERANKELQAFSSTVSHDLRAPLRAINGYSRLLLENEATSLSADGKGLLDRVVANSNKLGTLIEEILEYSRAGQKPLDRAPVDLGKLARAVAEELAGQHPAARVEVASLPLVEGDATMLHQILANLIGNALKFSASRPEPRVEVGCRREEGKEVFFVRDNGAGFDMRYAGRLFGMFQRLHSEKEFPGTGVGLAIVKRLIERHGGRIWAESAPDSGATFHFTLPPPGSAA